MRSSTASSAYRPMRRELLLVHCTFKAQPRQAPRWASCINAVPRTLLMYRGFSCCPFGQAYVPVPAS